MIRVKRSKSDGIDGAEQAIIDMTEMEAGDEVEIDGVMWVANEKGELVQLSKFNN